MTSSASTPVLHSSASGALLVTAHLQRWAASRLPSPPNRTFAGVLHN